jgi:hypothetical protein
LRLDGRRSQRGLRRRGSYGSGRRRRWGLGGSYRYRDLRGDRHREESLRRRRGRGFRRHLARSPGAGGLVIEMRRRAAGEWQELVIKA